VVVLTVIITILVVTSFPIEGLSVLLVGANAFAVGLQIALFFFGGWGQEAAK